MKIFRNALKISSLLGAIVFLAPTLFAEGGTGKYVVVISKENTYKASPEEMKRNIADIYLKKSASWSGGQKAAPFSPPQGKQEEEMFMKQVLKMDRSQFEQYWASMKQKNGTTRPREIKSSSLLVKFLKKYPGGIGIMKRKDAEKYGEKVMILFSFD